MVISLAMRANCFDMRFQRANIACFLTSNMRPINPDDPLIGRRAMYLRGGELARKRSTGDQLERIERIVFPPSCRSIRSPDLLSQREVERGAAIRFGLRPNFAAVTLHDALDQSQSDTGTFEILR